MKRTTLLLASVLFFGLGTQNCTKPKPAPVAVKPATIAKKKAPVFVHRYFMAFYQTNDGSVGSISFRCKGYPSEKEVYEVIREANHFTSKVQIVLTDFTEFKSSSDFTEWNK